MSNSCSRPGRQGGEMELPEREKLVVTLCDYEELTLRDGEVLGVTESRVSKLRTKAIVRRKRTFPARPASPPSRRRRGRLPAPPVSWSS